MKQFITKASAVALLVAAGLFANSNAVALDVKLTDYLAYIDVNHNGEQVRIQRIQDVAHKLDDGFAKTSRKCPPFCVQPMKVAPGVTTVGEAEIFRFMDRELVSGKGLSWMHVHLPGTRRAPSRVRSIFLLPSLLPVKMLRKPSRLWKHSVQCAALKSGGLPAASRS